MQREEVLKVDETMSKYQNLIFADPNLFLSKNKRLKSKMRDTLADLGQYCRLILLSSLPQEQLLELLKQLKLSDQFNAIFADPAWPSAELLAQVIKKTAIDHEASLLVSDNLHQELQLAKEQHLDTVWLSRQKNIIGLVPTIHLKKLSDLSFYLVW